MRTTTQILFSLLIVMCMPKVSEAQSKDSGIPFLEYCANNATSLSNSQASWSCIGRTFDSPNSLYSWLKQRNPRSEWKNSLGANGEPVLTNLKDKQTFWDCQPGVSTCGIWVKYTSTQLIFIQQLLDQKQNNRWLGVGLTLYCEGTKADCRKAQEKVSKILPPIDLRSTSTVGTPPAAVPPPPNLTMPSVNSSVCEAIPAIVYAAPKDIIAATISNLEEFVPQLSQGAKPSVRQYRRGIILFVTTSQDGLVSNITISRSTGNRSVDRAVMNWAYGIRFAPHICNEGFLLPVSLSSDKP